MLSNFDVKFETPKKSGSSWQLNKDIFIVLSHILFVYQDSASSENAESVSSLSANNEFSLSMSIPNLIPLSSTINEQHIPIAMAINEYIHAWFKGSSSSEYMAFITYRYLTNWIFVLFFNIIIFFSIFDFYWYLPLYNITFKDFNTYIW